MLFIRFFLLADGECRRRHRFLIQLTRIDRFVRSKKKKIDCFIILQILF